MRLRLPGVLLALLFLWALPLCAMSLSQAEKSLDSKKTSELFRAYDTFKTTYIKASSSGDEALKLRALRGIVKSGKALHIDVASYETKLSELSTQAVKKQSNEPKTKPQTLAKVQTATSQVKVTGQNRLKDVRWDNGVLVFEFTKTIGSKDVNYFKLNKSGKKGYRYVFDVNAALDRSRTLKHKDLSSIRLSQYKPSTIRLVLESSEKLTVRFSKQGRRLSVDAGIASVTSPKTQPVRIAATAKRGKVVVIDPGHGGKDPGAIGYKKIREKEIVFSIANKTAALLRERGYTVHMTRSDDRFVKLRNRTHYANRKRADLFVSVHANAVAKRKAKKVYGLETYFLSPSRSRRATNAAAKENRAEVEDMNFYGKNTFLNALNSEKIVASHKLAIDLQASVLSSLRARYKNVKDGGVREGPFWVLVGAQMPAVLVEVGFITHPTEGNRLSSGKYQDYFARGLADGVERYFAKNR